MISLNQQLAWSDQQAPQSDADDAVAIETRFGVFEFTTTSKIHMPRGPHGFTEFREFGLANLPEPAPAHFKLLQSLEESQLSFIVTVLDPTSGAVAADDLKDGATSVGIAFDEAIFLLIVTLRAGEAGTTATVNMRAPIVLDLDRRLARQVVLANNAYPIQQPL